MQPGEVTVNIYAVIAEFNPFHNGHGYLAEQIKKKAPDSALVAVMSGNFTQRGEPAVTDKYARAEAALFGGVDLVLELPAPWCFSGAEFFALGGVAVAEGLGVCDGLVFGSEVGDVEALIRCESRLSSEEYVAAYGAARRARPSKNTGTLRAEVYGEMYGESDILSGSNNLLALEYISALRKLGSRMMPHTVKRVGANFNSSELSGICSASAIRAALGDGTTDFSDFMPSEAQKILAREISGGRIYDMSALDVAVIAMLRAADPKRLSVCMEVSGGLENRLCATAEQCRTVAELVSAVKSKRYPESRVRRAILSCMLGAEMSHAEKKPLFTNVLAANGRGREVLALARKRADIAVLSKLSDSKLLPPEAMEQYALHMRAERLLELCTEAEPRRIGAVMR